MKNIKNKINQAINWLEALFTLLGALYISIFNLNFEEANLLLVAVTLHLKYNGIGIKGPGRTFWMKLHYSLIVLFGFLGTIALFTATILTFVILPMPSEAVPRSIKIFLIGMAMIICSILAAAIIKNLILAIRSLFYQEEEDNDEEVDED